MLLRLIQFHRNRLKSYANQITWQPQLFDSPALAPVPRRSSIHHTLHQNKVGLTADISNYRLAGTIPLAVIRAMRAEREQALNSLKQSKTSGREIARHQKRFFAKYDSYLDAHPGESWLSQAKIGQVIIENLHYHRGNLYHLLAYCVMPNHVDVLLQPFSIAEGNTFEE